MAHTPVRLWLFTKGRDSQDVLRVMGKHRVPAEHTAVSPHWARDLGDGFLIWNSYGEYGGPLGRRPGVLSEGEDAVRHNITRKHPDWSAQKVTRAVRDHLRHESSGSTNARQMQALITDSERTLAALAELARGGSVYMVLEQSEAIETNQVVSMSLCAIRPMDLMALQPNVVLQFVE